MNKVRSILFSVIVVISSSTLALGGEMQFPGRADPPSPASSTESTNDGAPPPAQADEIQSALQGLATAVLNQVLLLIY